MKEFNYIDTDSVRESNPYYKMPDYDPDQFYEVRLMERSKAIDLINAKYGIIKAEVKDNAET